MDISFTTTAMCRPDILNKTYESFNQNLKGIDLSKYTLFINIDPLPDLSLRKDTIEIAKQFFGNVISNEPKDANFTLALKWLWKTADSEYVFHLEDDWIMNREIHIQEMLDKLQESSCLQCLMRAYPEAYNNMSLSPSLMKKYLYKHIVNILNDHYNPESQIQSYFVRNNDSFNRYNAFSTINDNKKQIDVTDIGRDWLSNTEFKRPEVKRNFTKWIHRK